MPNQKSPLKKEGPTRNNTNNVLVERAYAVLRLSSQLFLAVKCGVKKENPGPAQLLFTNPNWYTFNEPIWYIFILKLTTVFVQPPSNILLDKYSENHLNPIN